MVMKGLFSHEVFEYVLQLPFDMELQKYDICVIDG